MHIILLQLLFQSGMHSARCCLRPKRQRHLTNELFVVHFTSIRKFSESGAITLSGCFACRLISQLIAVLDQAASSTAAAAAIVASDTESAAVAAASRLAIFLPHTHLLTLTHTALSCVEPALGSSSISESSKEDCMAKLGLNLAEALISTWSENHGEEVYMGIGLEGEQRDEGSKASWSDIIKGLLRMALVCSRGSSETEADVLLLKALHKSNASAFDR